MLIKKRDIHNLMFLNKNLIGYTALERGHIQTGNTKKLPFI